MTMPYYNCDLIPGMIADYAFIPGGTDDTDKLWNWLDHFMTGPFLVTYLSTAHHMIHIQVSNEEDEKLICQEHIVEKFTESFRGDTTYPQQFMSFNAALERTKTESIYYGRNCVDITRWIEQHPLPVTNVSKRIREHAAYYEKVALLRERERLWESFISKGLKTVIPFTIPFEDAKAWCKTNCGGAYDVKPIPPNYLIIHNEKSVGAIFFENERDAILFKTFCE